MPEMVRRNIVMMGAPGSGKGTQSAILSEKLGINAFSMGDILRSVAKGTSEEAHLVKSLIDKGNMVPDQLAIRLMEEELFKPENENGYILDGFPRELSQAEALDEALNSEKYAKYHMNIDLVLLLQVPDDYVIDRIIGRYQCAHCKTLYHEKFKQPHVYGICDVCGGKEFTRRADDTYETVVSRLRTFRRVTAPVIPYYEMKGLLVCVDGTGPIDVVSEKIRKIVGY